MASYYRTANATCGQILSESLQFDAYGRLYRAHSAIGDFERWIQAIGPSREAELLSDALREYQTALLALLQGQYTSAFAELRLFLELGLASVYYSAHIVELHLFSAGELDVNWSAFMDPETGIFSHTFARAFNGELLDHVADYRGLAVRVYRECSEYIHGNANVRRKLPRNLTFSGEHYVSWNDKADATRIVLLFALSLRWLRNLPVESVRQVEAHVQEELGNLPGIRSALGGSVEVL
ncbi:hypothetical protein LIP_2270 [Limnochorda pilosa]|uniref:Uncharacterized protein n=1 Tax=Limnochorda pilosa TaxID=1555112 RepID=A0A0K2SLW2_LIMPI|nr:hypothetical protein LIP_2270 [Limnochorda pilosa]